MLYSPVSSLPPELVAEIMYLAKSECRHHPYKISAEVLFSHVSRFWRELALSTPKLWDVISIYSYESKDRVDAYLHRSGVVPISLSIDIYHIDKKKSRRDATYASRLLQFLAGTLQNTIERTTSLFLMCFYEETAVRLLSGTDTLSATVLQQVQLKYDCTMNFNFIPQSRHIFSPSIPRLQRLETDLPDFLPPPSSLNNLTTLYLHSMKRSARLTSDLLVENLKAMVNLEHLSLQGCIELRDWNPSIAFTMEKLRSLRLMDDSMMAVRMILSVTAPALESLWLDCGFSSFDTTLFNSPRMQGPTRFPSLKYLTLPADNFFRSDKFSVAFPTVTHLHVPYGAMQRHFHLFSTTLIRRWTSLHTIVLTMYRESNIEKLVEGLDVVLPARSDANRPIRQLIVDADYKKAIFKEAPRLADEVDIRLISVDIYHEHWWNANLRDRPGFRDVRS